MTPVLWYVVCLAVITWLSLLVASLILAKGWTLAGMQYAMGNRDGALAATALAGRADRTAKNNLESFVLFAALALVGHVAQADPERLKLGADLFFWSRLVFIVIYYVGVPYLRTLVWGVGTVGLAIMALTML